MDPGGCAARGALDGSGRLATTVPDAAATAAGELRGLYSRLLCADLALLGWRTVATGSRHLGICTANERTGGSLEFWAGAALRPDPGAALAAAAHDAFLAPWNGSVLIAGAARLVADTTCRAALVTDERGTTTFGHVDDFPALGGLGPGAEPGARLAARTPAGDFRALSLGCARVVLASTAGWGDERRVARWFDALEAILV